VTTWKKQLREFSVSMRLNPFKHKHLIAFLHKLQFFYLLVTHKPLPYNPVLQVYQ